MCRSLKSAKFSEGLEVLGTDEYPLDGGQWCGAFAESTLERIWLPITLKRIEYNTFYWCESLKGIDLPSGLEYLGDQCFCECGLQNVMVPRTVKVLGKHAFH